MAVPGADLFLSFQAHFHAQTEMHTNIIYSPHFIWSSYLLSWLLRKYIFCWREENRETSSLSWLLLHKQHRACSKTHWFLSRKFISTRYAEKYEELRFIKILKSMSTGKITSFSQLRGQKNNWKIRGWSHIHYLWNRKSYPPPQEYWRWVLLAWVQLWNGLREYVKCIMKKWLGSRRYKCLLKSIFKLVVKKEALDWRLLGLPHGTP